MPVSRRDLALTLALCAWAAAWLAPGLGHHSLHNWDESLHQWVTRGLAETPLTPHLLEAPLAPAPMQQWWYTGVWLHKPTGPFWLGALLLKLVGVTPAALRGVSLLAQVLATACIYLLARRAAGRGWAALAAAAFPVLPFGFLLTHGYMFGDVTDTTLGGCLALAAWLLVRACERDAVRDAALAGAAVGAGYLCKSALALTPLGVALVLCGTRAAGLTPFGPRPRALLALLGTAALVAVPWNLASALRWPAQYAYEAGVTLGHLTRVEQSTWVRPWDGVLAEANATTFAPLSPALPLLALLWTCARALARREPVPVVTALWVGATWLVLSFARIKVPGTAWGAQAGAFVALALLLQDAARRPALAGATLGALVAPLLVPHAAWLAAVRLALPEDVFFLARTWPGLAEGVALALLGAGVLGVLDRALRTWRPLPRVAGAACGVAAAAALLVQVPRAHAAARAEKREEAWVAHMREAGLALAAHAPARAVAFARIEHDPPCCFELQSLGFWSGRMPYRELELLPVAAARGLHPFLVSPGAEPYREVPGVPAHSPMRAYDLAAPAPPPGLPAGVVRLDARAGTVQVLGYAPVALSDRVGRWTFFLHADGEPHEVEVVLHGAEGRRWRRTLAPEGSLRSRVRLAGVPWFIVHALGPVPERVVRVEVVVGALRAPRAPTAP